MLTQILKHSPVSTSFYCEWFKLERFNTVEVDEKDSDGVPYEWGNRLKS